MPLTPIEWIVTIFAVIGLIKLIVITTNKQSWWHITKKFYNNPGLFGFIALILAAIVFYYLLQELTIVQIIAVATFVTLLVGFGFVGYSKEVLVLAEKILKKGFSGWTWFYILIWLILLVWALYEIFLI